MSMLHAFILGELTHSLPPAGTGPAIKGAADWSQQSALQYQHQ